MTELVTLTCINCGESWQGPPPRMCCSGRDCGCMGLPVDGPIVCDEKCWDEYVANGYKSRKQIEKNNE